MASAVVYESVPREISVTLKAESLTLAPAVQDVVDREWSRAVREHPDWFRGEVFSIAHMSLDPKRLGIELKRTDYAHYLATIRGLLDQSDACRVLYGAGIGRTADNYLVFGQMGRHTAYGGRLQGVGGGLDFADVNQNAVDVVGSVRRELAEELGLVSAAIVPRWLKQGGPWDFVVLVCEVSLPLTLRQLLQQYRTFVRQVNDKGGVPEFEELVALKGSWSAVEDFLAADSRPRVDYLSQALRRMAEQR